jgi:ATP-dependent DNA ligase
LQVKPDYISGMNDTLDVIILGGYYGEGKVSPIRLILFDSIRCFVHLTFVPLALAAASR